MLMRPNAAGPSQGVAAGERRTSPRQRALTAFLVACVLQTAGFVQDAYAQVGDSIKLVGNTDQPVFSGHATLGSSDRNATGQSFTTGDDRGGYLLDYATVRINASHDKANIDLEVSIRTEQNNGSPASARLITLTRDGVVSNHTHNQFDAPDGSAVLKPSTSYFLALQCLNDSCGLNTDNELEIGLTEGTANGEDSDGEDDWDISNHAHVRNGDSWVTIAESLRIRAFGWKANRAYIVDDGVQIISTPTATADGDTYGLGDRIEFEVTFNKIVQLAPGANPGFKFRVSGSDRTATYNSGSGTRKLRFIYTVVAGDTDSNGISVRNQSHTLADEEGNITDSAGNPALLDHGSLGTDISEHKIDSSITRPAITSLQIVSTPLAASTYGLGETIQFNVDFDTAVAVTPTPKLALQVGTNTREAGYTSGSPGTSLNFDYEVVAGDTDSNGISIPANALATDGDRYMGPLGGGAIVKDSGSRPNARLVSDAVTASTGHKVDSALNRFAATGTPAIAGVAKAGRTLTAEKGTIADRNGTTKADNGIADYAYTYQWVRVVSGTDTDISGATSKTYMPVTADVGNPLKVKASFKDDADNPEGPLTSTETLAVTAFVAPTTVARGWSLTPSGLAIGARFRLLFISSTTRDASPTAIGNYNTFVQNRAAAGHAGIRAYSAGFRVVGCTADTDAIDNTDTAHAPTDKGVPIYWLNGTKVADNYQDFYDGSWDDEANDKNESGSNGPNTAESANYPFTGCDDDGTEKFFTGTSHALGSANGVTVGRLNNPVSPNNPIGSNSSTGRTSTRPMYGLSEVFEAATSTATTVPDIPTLLTARANGETEIRLAWTGPGDDGGADVTGYRIEVSARGGSNWNDLVADTESTYTGYEHTGLTAGKSRAYRVSAINSEGTGSPSDTRGATTAAANVLVSNTGQNADPGQRFGTGNVNRTRSQGFRTGANPGGYGLASVGLYINEEDLEPGETFIVHIYTDNGSGGLGTLVHTLTSPTSYRNNAVSTFTAPADATLEASTDYHVVFEGTGNDPADMLIGFTPANGEDIGSRTGWQIEDSRRLSDVPDFPPSNYLISVNGAAVPTGVASTWGLIPTGLGIGDTFRLLFLSSTKRNTLNMGISFYNTHIQDAAAAGHTDIQSYSAGFRVVGCSIAVDGRNNTRMIFTESDKGVPIYWLNGTKVADDYEDFYDGDWDEEENDKDESGADGPDTSVTANFPWTGCAQDGKEYFDSGNSTHALDSGGSGTRVGKPDSSATNEGPIDGNSSFSNSQLRPLYGLSELFRVATSTDPIMGANNAATGTPAITGTAKVGNTLQATKNTIADDDGTTKADNDDAGYAYTYQWVRVVSGTETDIAGATSDIYIPVLADVGSTLKVKMSFKDDADNPEGPLVSAVTAAVQDTPPVVSIAGEMRLEGSGSVRFVISQNRPGGTDRPFTVSLSTSDGTATAGDDYVAANSQSVPFSSGDNSKARTVFLHNDDIDEVNETFTATITLESGSVTLGTDTATGTIIDDDTAGVTVSETARTVTEEDTSGATYTVVLDSEPTADVTIEVGGTSGTDVTADPATLTFATSTWATAQTVTVTAGNDSDNLDDSATLTHTATSADANYSGISINSVTVTVNDNDALPTTPPEDWSLTPDGLAVGARFRLLFLSSTMRNASPTAISDYNTFVQNRAADGHDDIQAYSAGFRVVGCTAAVDARDNTATTYTTADKGVPIYWLNGNKVADDYEDFYDGDWDEEAADKNQSGNNGPNTSQSDNYPFTGCDDDGTEAFSGANSRALGNNGQVRVGRPDSNASADGPIGSDNAAGNTSRRPFYGLSEVFEAATSTATTVPDIPTLLTARANGETEIRLAWTGPGDDGGADVTGYRIEVSARGGSNWNDLVADTESTYTGYEHTGLTAGKSRAYRVSAINSEGTGSPSDTRGATTAAANVLVSNTGQNADPAQRFGTGNVNRTRSQGFRTGANPGGYGLASVGLYINEEDLEPGETFIVHIYTDNGSGGLGTLVHTLTSPTSYRNNAVSTFTAPADATLEASTDYHVVFEGTGNDPADMLIGFTPANGEDIGSRTGWQIEDSRRLSDVPDSPPSNYLISVNGAAVPTGVASTWGLIPTGLGIGDTFRLLFLSSTKRNTLNMGISFYNTHIQDAAAAGHTDIQSYSAGFRVVGCSTAVDGRNNTRMIFTTSDKGVPIYWLNGTKVADDYEDFYDGDWDEEENDKNESGADGPDTSVTANFPWTGCAQDGKEYFDSGNSTHALDSGGSGTRVGKPDSSATNEGPIDGNSSFSNSQLRPLYGLSELFRVATSTDPIMGANNTATGTPAITGTAKVGNTLQATKNTIADDDGTTKADNDDAGYAYTYQWVRVVSGTETDIAGATSDIYIPVLADVGSTLKVKMSFKDDADNPEGPLVSAVTAAVQDTPPVVSIAGEMRLEGSGSVRFVISQNRPGGTDRPFTVSLSTSDGTATAGDDYVAANSQSVPFSVGDNSKPRAVFLHNDDIDEVNETFTATITLESGSVTLGTDTATGTIIDDDTAGVTVSETARTVTEEDTSGATYTVVLDSEPTADVTIEVGGTSGTDVTADPATLTFATSTWATAQTVTVTAGNDSDNLDDSATLTHTATSADANYSGISINSVTVTVNDNDALPTTPPEDWSLTPDGLAVGARFRLLFLSSTMRNASPTAISDYNTFVQNRAADGHDDIQAYSAGFRVVGCTAAVDARDNTATTYTTADKGIPIYWLNGNKVADDYEDFYDGDWDEEAADKNQSGNNGPNTSQSDNYPFTGCDDDGTEAFSGANSRALGNNGQVRVGRPDSNASADGPIGSDNAAGNTSRRPFYGLSEVFEAATSTATTVPDIPTLLTARANGETEIRLAWTGPGDDGGADVTGYRIEVSARGGSNWNDLVADTESTYTGYEHTGLTAGKSRAYRVSAINSEGTGSPSDTRGATTAAANVLVSNTGQNADPGQRFGTGNVNRTRSQGFRTGANPGGYGLASVGLYINEEDLEPGETFIVHIYTDNGSGGLGTLVHTLTSPTSYRNNAVSTFTAPADATLEASTDYHVVFEGTGNDPADMLIGFTPANGEDIGSRTGWQIEDSRRLSDVPDSPPSNYLISVNGAAVPTGVASTWGLIPTGLGIGDTFRLLFLSSTKRNTLNMGISFYNTHIQDAAAAGHTDIQSYSAGFRVVGCSIAVDGRNNTRMIFTESDKGVPIYWLNGTKVADDYEDFYDGDWDEEENDKNESGADGPDTSVTANFPWTGCAQDGKEYFDSGNSTHALDSGGSGTRVGKPDSSATNEGPIDGNSSFSNSQLRPLYGLSELFRVATSTDPIMGANNAATGTPAITGTAKVGNTLQATKNTIADDDGTTKADNDDAGYAYTYQWVRVVSGTETDIAGATSDIYIPVLADVGSTLKVKMSFKDDADNPEGPLVSAVTAAVQDTPPVVSIAGEMRLEGSGSVRFVISQNRPGGTDRPFTVSLSTSDGTATAGDDYVAANSQSVPFSVGDNSKARTVFLHNDDIDEVNETFTATITLESGSVTLGTDTATGTILDDDEASVSLSKMALTVLEEDATGNTYDVALTSEPTAEVVVTVTGTAGTDVTATPGTLTFATSTWATAQTVTITAADDSDTDNDAATLVHVGASADPNYVGILGGNLTVTVTDNDIPNVAATGAPMITGTAKVGQALFATTGTIADTNGTTKAEAREAGYAFTYQWVRTANGTDTDIPGAILDTYTPVLADVGAALKVRVSFKDDADNPEGPLTSASTAAVLDTPPVVSIADETRLEGDGVVAFTISLDGSGGSDRAFTVSASTSDGTATAGDDYVELAGQTVQFSIGDTTRTISVNVNDDSIAEADETFTVTITVASGSATIGTGTATATILNDDNPAVRLAPDSLTVVEAQSNVYRVVLQTLPTDDVTVTIPGVSGDLSLDKTTLDFTPSDWSNPQTVTVTAADDEDSAQDADVTLMHLASGASEYQGLSAALVVSIRENDPSLVFSKTALSVPEGGTADYAVALATVPSADVMVTISGVSGDLSLDKTSLEFTPANWDVPQTVVVAAAEDSDSSMDPAVTLTHTASGGDYNTIVGELRVTVTENDSSGGGSGGGGGGGGSANHPPVVEREIEDQTLAVGEILELDIRLNFYDRDQRVLDYSVKSAAPSVAEAGVDRNGLLSIQGVKRGVTALTVTVADRRDERASDTFAVTVTGPVLVALVPIAADPMREGFVRLINHSGESGEVAIEAIDDAGMRAGPISLALDAGETVHFNSKDLEDGNADKGLADGVGPGEDNWRLVLDSELDFEVLSYIRTQDGFLTAMHDVAPLIDGAYRVATFNPGENPNQVSHLRLINPGETIAAVTVEGIDDEGDSPGDAVTFDVPADESVTLTGSDLEAGTGLNGALGDGSGKWRLSVTSDQAIVAMSLLSSPTGHLTNLSALPPAPGEGGAHVVPLFPSASDALGRQGFVRVVNRSADDGDVTIEASEDTDTVYETVTLAIDTGETVHFNSDDLELGNAAKGLSGSTGSGTGDWRLAVTSDLDIDVLAYIRTADGFLTSMHAVAPESPVGRRVATFNPGSNPNQVSRLRLVNPGDEDAVVTVTGIDDAGASPGSAVTVTVSAGSSRTIAAADLEAGGEGFEGALGDGKGKWRLAVTSEQPVMVMSLLSSPTGHLTNLSTAPDRDGI